MVLRRKNSAKMDIAFFFNFYRPVGINRKKVNAKICRFFHKFSFGTGVTSVALISWPKKCFDFGRISTARWVEMKKSKWNILFIWSEAFIWYLWLSDIFKIVAAINDRSSNSIFTGRSFQKQIFEKLNGTFCRDFNWDQNDTRLNVLAQLWETV